MDCVSTSASSSLDWHSFWEHSYIASEKKKKERELQSFIFNCHWGQHNSILKHGALRGMHWMTLINKKGERRDVWAKEMPVLKPNILSNHMGTEGLCICHKIDL